MTNTTQEQVQETKQDVTLETLSTPKEFAPTYTDDPEQLKMKTFSYTRCMTILHDSVVGYAPHIINK